MIHFSKPAVLSASFSFCCISCYRTAKTAGARETRKLGSNPGTPQPRRGLLSGPQPRRSSQCRPHMTCGGKSCVFSFAVRRPSSYRASKVRVGSGLRLSAFAVCGLMISPHLVSPSTRISRGDSIRCRAPRWPGTSAQRQRLVRHETRGADDLRRTAAASQHIRDPDHCHFAGSSRYAAYGQHHRGRHRGGS
jgi:hypothetical protein